MHDMDREKFHKRKTFFIIKISIPLKNIYKKATTSPLLILNKY